MQIFHESMFPCLLSLPNLLPQFSLKSFFFSFDSYLLLFHLSYLTTANSLTENHFFLT